MNIGDFEVLDEIRGGGSNASVYKARHRTLGRTVILKRIQVVEKGSDDRELRRFLNEARSMAEIHSDHVVTLYGIHEIDGWHTLELEYMPGGSLRDLLDKRTLSRDAAVDCCRQVLQGITDIHAHGLIHRDIKPGNILVDGSGRYKVADFGIAMRKGERPTAIQGTAQYIAPETLEPPFEFDERADLYAAGIMLFEALVGKAKFETAFGDLFDGGVVAADRKWMNWACDRESAPPRVDSIDREIPSPVADVIERLLEKDPARRYGSAREALTDLNDAFRPGANRPMAPTQRFHPPGLAPTKTLDRATTPPSVQPAPTRWRPKMVHLVIGSVIAAVAILFVQFMMNRTVDIVIDTKPSGARVVWNGGEHESPFAIRELHPKGSIRVEVSKPGYATKMVDVAIENGGAAPVIELTPNCLEDSGGDVGRPEFGKLRVAPDGDAPPDEFWRQLEASLPFVAVVAPACPSSDAQLSLVGGKLTVRGAKGQVTTIPDTGARSDVVPRALEKALGVLYVRHLLTLGRPANPSGLQFYVSAGLEHKKTDPPSVVIGKDALLKFPVLLSDRAYVLLVVVDSSGDLVIVSPEGPGEKAIDAGQWVPIGDSLEVDAPAGLDVAIAIAGPEPWWPLLAQQGMTSHEDVNAELIRFSMGDKPHRSAAAQFALSVAKRLVSLPAWSRAEYAYDVLDGGSGH